MSQSRKKNGTFLVSFGRQLAGVFDDLTRGLNFLIKKPFDELTKASRRSDKPTSKKTSSKSLFAAIVAFPLTAIAALLSIGIKLLISPAEVLVGIAKGRTKTLWVSLPLCIALLGGVFFYKHLSNKSEAIRKQRDAAMMAYREGNFKKSVFQFEKLISLKTPLTTPERFAFAQSLLNAKQPDRARAIIDDLAPGVSEQSGYAPAHRLKAVSIALAMRKPMDADTGKKLKWHLDAGGESKAPDFQRAWAEYYLGIKDSISAVEHLERAAASQPELWLFAARLHQAIGNQVRFENALEKSREVFLKKLSDDNKNPNHRIVLAEILFEQGKHDEAERVLLEPIDFSPDQLKLIKSARANHYLKRYEFSSVATGQTAELDRIKNRFELLKTALHQDLNHLPTYQSLIRFYLPLKDKAAGREVVDTLKKAVSEGDSTGLAHFALSNILWENEEQELAQFHMEQAFRLSPKDMTAVANNLAWILTEGDNPDLKRAYELSKQVVDRYPNDGRLRDTYARVLKKQKKYNAALIEFKRALPTVTDKSAVHKEIVEIYKALGKPELATQALELSKLNEQMK